MAFGLKVRWVSRWPGNKASLPFVGRGGVVIVVNPADISYDEDKVWDQSCLSSSRRQSFVKRQTHGWCRADKSTLSRNTFVRCDPLNYYNYNIRPEEYLWTRNLLITHLLPVYGEKLLENILNSNIIYSVHLRHVFGTHNEDPPFKLYVVFRFIS